MKKTLQQRWKTEIMEFTRRPTWKLVHLCALRAAGNGRLQIQMHWKNMFNNKNEIYNC